MDSNTYVHKSAQLLHDGGFIYDGIEGGAHRPINESGVSAQEFLSSNGYVAGTEKLDVGEDEPGTFITYTKDNEKVRWRSVDETGAFSRFAFRKI